MIASSMHVNTETIEETLLYQHEPLLKYQIYYPQFTSVLFQKAAGHISRYYAAEAASFKQYCRHQLFRLAIREYEHAIRSGYPVRVFEAVLRFDVTLNQDCASSLYFDRYEYAGGAHGSTYRFSDTWNLQTGRRRPLSSFIISPISYRVDVIHSIVQQISGQQNDEQSYFDDYRKNTAKYFNPASFYLTPQGVTIYFQQYEIAPYASGIPTFIMPYSRTVVRPQCRFPNKI